MAERAASAIMPRLHRPWVLISDLDGTILDHWDYSSTAMMPLLEALEAAGIPVVFNTSKTAAELELLRPALRNRHPFIVENGSAIYLPRDYFPHDIDDAEQHQNYHRIVLGTPVQAIRSWLDEVRQSRAFDLVTFSELRVSEVAALADMSEAAAAPARLREFSEVIRWRGSASERSEFLSMAEQAGWRTLQGGRFLHLLGPSDKGKASLRLLREYHRFHGRRPSLLVAGDGENDIDMLRLADLALLVRSPNHKLPLLADPEGQVMVSREPGPEGLARLLRELLAQY